jgi:hypothetical protein
MVMAVRLFALRYLLLAAGVAPTTPPPEPGPGTVVSIDCMVALDGIRYDDIILGIKLREKIKTVTDKTWVCTAFFYSATFA